MSDDWGGGLLGANCVICSKDGSSVKIACEVGSKGERLVVGSWSVSIIGFTLLNYCSIEISSNFFAGSLVSNHWKEKRVIYLVSQEKSREK